MLFELIILIIIVAIILLLFKVMKKIVVLIFNSIIGLLALFGFNSIFSPDITINVWSVLITAIGGAIGFIVLVVLHYFKFLF